MFKSNGAHEAARTHGKIQVFYMIHQQPSERYDYHHYKKAMLFNMTAVPTPLTYIHPGIGSQ